MKLEKLTALYSPLDIEYSQAMSGPYENLSFQSEDITIIAGLKDGRISGFWRPVVAVGDDKLQKAHIERLYDICRNIYYMDFLIDGKLSVISQFLLRHEHRARPYYTQIIDLTKSKEELHVDLRKSYKSLVCKHPVYIGSEIEYVRRLHKKRRGITRLDVTWDIQKKMLNEKEAFVCAPITYKAAVLVYWNKNSAYYACGASELGFNSHEAIWASIVQAKSLGCKNFELGEQIFSGDEKLVNISKFKRGFGGETKTRLILEKEK